MSGFTRGPSRSPDLGEPQTAQDVSTTQTATYRMSQRVWTNARISTSRHIRLWTKLEQINGLTCTQ